jgi:ketosteroid isomerase-like protein
MNPTNKEISEAFAKGNLEFSGAYLADDIQWNIIGNSLVTGKKEVLEVAKMSQLESFPVITIKNIIAEGNYTVVESTGKALTKSGKPYNQTYCDIFYFKDNKLKEITTYLDTALSKEALN